MTLLPDDLRTDDGEIDARTMRDDDSSRADPVARKTCAEWRQRALGAESGRDIAADTGRADSVVRYHLTGECSHTGAHPPLECVNKNRGAYRVSDSYACERCGAHVTEGRRYCEDCFLDLQRRGVAIDLTRGD